MNKYLFILGQSPVLSQEELKAVLSSKNDHIELISDLFVLASTDKQANDLMAKLGGTIKIARYVASLDNLDQLTADYWYELLKDNLGDSKNHFGFSLYSVSNKQIQKTAFQVKKLLTAQGYKSRLVSSKDPILSSVIVAKNKLINRELLIIRHQDKYLLAITEAVQDFASYGLRDIKRPYRDNRSGMLPPKLARMMINLESGKNILDPFCGSGTILQEAMMLGYQKIYGSDISSKAVSDTDSNLKWLKDKFNIQADIKIIKSDVKEIAEHFDNHSIDLIVTEPFMGDARTIARVNNLDDVVLIKKELDNLYQSAFKNFKNILSDNGKIIFIFPIFDIDNQDIATLDKQKISQLGYNYMLDKDIVYSRDRQKVKRQITVWQIKK